MFHALWVSCFFCAKFAPSGIQVSSIRKPCQHRLKLNRLKTLKSNLSFPQKHPRRWFFLLCLIWYPFLSSFFTPSPRRSREPCRVLKFFCHFNWEALNPICLILYFLSRGNPFFLCFAFAFTFMKIYYLSGFSLN